MPRKKRSASPFELMDDDFDDNSSQSSRNGNPPIQRNAANARERARMRVLSSAFGRLKTKLPNIPADTKLSKLDTLRLATMYIKQLKAVVEGGSGANSPTTNGEIMEGTLNNNTQNCYLNLNSGVQSMNWPFGFHQHLTNSSLIRTTSSNNLINSNNNSNHNNSSSSLNSNNNNNWCPNDTTISEEQIKHSRYDNENYEQHQQQQHQTSSYMEHNTSLLTSNNHHWYSETPSPEMDSTFENTHLQRTVESNHHQQQLHNNQHHTHHHHHHLHHMTHLTTAHSSSSPYHMQQDFLHQPTASSHHLHLPSNRFVNSTNFQSTSIH